MNAQATLFDLPVPALTVDQDALGFLIKFASNRLGESFSSEQVTIAAEAMGISFSDQRSWGSVFTTAARDGYIRRSDVLFSRQFGNGSLAPGWVGV